MKHSIRSIKRNVFVLCYQSFLRFLFRILSSLPYKSVEKWSLRLVSVNQCLNAGNFVHLKNAKLVNILVASLVADRLDEIF